MPGGEEQDWHRGDIAIAKLHTTCQSLRNGGLRQFEKTWHHRALSRRLLHLRGEGQKFSLSVRVTAAVADEQERM
jgi:hypothetical protein